MSEHENNLAVAFNGQAAQFERAPVQTDVDALRRLVEFADFPENALVLDAGCGPGLVAEAFLHHGCRIYGVDLSREMIARARRRCESFERSARFEERSLFDPIIDESGPFDGSISRYVLHHVVDPFEFLHRQVSLLKSGGILVLSDHTTDPDRELADRHEFLERLRDTTHTRNHTLEAIATFFEQLGLTSIQTSEEAFRLDFDEWFNRGTPAISNAEFRRKMLEGPMPRGFAAVELPAGRVRIDCFRALVRGVKP